MQYIIVVIGSFLAGFLQSCTGFGAVMIMMILFPFYLPMSDSIGIANGSTLAGNFYVSFQNRKAFSVKKALVPSTISIVFNCIATFISIGVDKTLVKKAFGVFLILLSLYYLLFNKSKKWTLSIPLQYIMIVGFAISSAFFGIGGPLIAVYFMNTTSSREEYLGSIQFFFLLTGLFNVVIRFSMGLLTTKHLLPMIIGMFCVVVSGIISKPFVKKLNVKYAEIMTYLLVGLTGIYNLLF